MFYRGFSGSLRFSDRPPWRFSRALVQEGARRTNRSQSRHTRPADGLDQPIGYVHDQRSGDEMVCAAVSQRQLWLPPGGARTRKLPYLVYCITRCSLTHKGAISHSTNSRNCGLLKLSRSVCIWGDPCGPLCPNDEGAPRRSRTPPVPRTSVSPKTFGFMRPLGFPPSSGKIFCRDAACRVSRRVGASPVSTEKTTDAAERVRPWRVSAAIRG